MLNKKKRLWLIVLIFLIVITGVYTVNYFSDSKESFEKNLTDTEVIFLARDYAVKNQLKKALKVYKAYYNNHQDNVNFTKEYLGYILYTDQLDDHFNVVQNLYKISKDKLFPISIMATYYIKHDKVTKLEKLYTEIGNIINTLGKNNPGVQKYDLLYNTIGLILAEKNKKNTQSFLNNIKKINLHLYSYILPVLTHTRTADPKALISVYSQSIASSPEINQVLTYTYLLYKNGNTNQAIDVFERYLGDKQLSKASIKYYIKNYDLIKYNVSDIMSYTLSFLAVSSNDKAKSAHLLSSKLQYTILANYISPKIISNILSLAKMVGDHGSTKLALRLYDKIPKDSFIQRYIYYKIASTYQDLGFDTEAIKVLNKQIKNDPYNPIPISELAHLYYKRGDYAHAIKKYTQSLEIAKKNDYQIGIWIGLFFRAMSYNKYGQWENAEKDLLDAIEIRKEPMMLNYLSFLWIEHNKNLEDARRLIETSLSKDPNNINFLDSYAWYFYKVRDYNRALEIMENVIKVMPLDPEINEHYALILLSLLQDRKALLYFNKAYNLYSNNIDKKRVKQLIKKIK